jgi:predicted transcriptional regulator
LLLLLLVLVIISNSELNSSILIFIYLSLQLEQLKLIRTENAAMEEELAKNKANDPEEHKRITQEVLLLKAGAERWTDNVWAVKSYLVKKRGMSGKETDKMLGIDGNFDYLA